MKYYMHTIDGKAAFFDPIGKGICYASKYAPQHHNILVSSLNQIKRERREDAKGRALERISNQLSHICVYA